MKTAKLRVKPLFENDKWPYTSAWKMQGSGRVVGKTVGAMDGRNDKYFLPKQFEESRQ